MNNSDITAEWLYQKRIDGARGTIAYTDKYEVRIAELTIKNNRYHVKRGKQELTVSFGNEIEAVRFYNGEGE